MSWGRNFYRLLFPWVGFLFPTHLDSFLSSLLCFSLFFSFRFSSFLCFLFVCSFHKTFPSRFWYGHWGGEILVSQNHYLKFYPKVMRSFLSESSRLPKQSLLLLISYASLFLFQTKVSHHIYKIPSKRSPIINHQTGRFSDLLFFSSLLSCLFYSIAPQGLPSSFCFFLQ